MKTKKISKPISQKNNEALASRIYLAYAAWAKSLGFAGIANFLFRHKSDEQYNITKIFGKETDGTKAVYKLVKLDYDKDDWASSNFMNWFMKEQMEEEKLAMNLLNKIKLADLEKKMTNAKFIG